jgi:hypothetical protein
MPPVAGYTPDAMGFYVPPGGAKLLDIQTGQPVDPGKNFVTPPAAPDYLGVGASGPTDQIQLAVTSGYDKPSSATDPNAIQKAAAAIQKKQAETDASSTGTGTKRTATPAPAAAPAATTPPAPAPAPPAPGPASPSPDLHPAPNPANHIAPPAPSGDLQAFGQQVAAKYGVPWDIFYWQIAGESNWDPNTRDSTKGAVGIAQFEPDTAKAQGVTNPRDPRQALEGAAKYMAKLYQMSGGSWIKALNAYNMGEGRMNEPPAGETLAVTAYATAYHNAGYTLADAKNQERLTGIQRDYETKAANARKAAVEAREALNAGEKDFPEMMRRVRAAQDKADQAQDAAMKAIAEQPKQPVIDGVKHMNSIAVLVGLLGGLMTKAPMLASTNAAAAAIEAYNAGDLRAYNIAHDAWKDQTSLLFKIADMNRSRVMDIMNEEKLPIEERRAKVDALLRIQGQQELADQARIDGDKSILDWDYKQRELDYRFKQLEQQQRTTKTVYDKVNNRYGEINPITNKTTWYDSGVVPASAVTGRYAELTPMQQGELQRRVDDFVSKHQTDNDGQGPTQTEIEEYKYGESLKIKKDAALAGARPTSGSQAAADENAYTDTYVEQKVAALGHPPSKAEIAQFRLEGRAEAKNTLRGVGVINDEAANLIAQQMILGDTRALTSLPRSGPSRTKVENRFAELLRDQGDDAARAVVMKRLRMLEAESAARVAGRVTMQTEIFAKEATDAGAEVVRTSKLVPRTDQPMFNRALEAFYRQEGDPNIIAFGAALSAFINAYGKMSNPTGTGVHDADKERIQQAIDQSLSQGQIEAGVNQVVTEGVIISNAARSAQEKVLQGLAPTGITPSTAAPPPPSSDTPPAGAPSGSRKAPDGHWYAPDPARPGKFLRVD